MSASTIISKRLSRAGITTAAIIDDVYNGPAFLDVRSRISAFRDDIEDDDAATKELRERYSVDITDSIGIPLVHRFWKDFEDLTALKRHVEILLTDYFLRRQMVNRIAAHIESLGISVRQYPDAEGDETKLPPEWIPLVFLDYSLAPDSPTPSRASEWCATKLCERGIRRPFLVLISDHDNAEAHKESFREKTRQLGGTFAFVRKQAAQDPDFLFLQIATWGLGHPAHIHLQAFVDATIESMDKTISQFRKTLASLTVQDYSFIQRISLEEDGQPLGEYMLEFLTGLLSHQFRANAEIQATRKSLDRLSFDHQLACSTQPSSELARMYRLALTDPVFDEINPHPHDTSQPSMLEGHQSAHFENAFHRVRDRAYDIWVEEGYPGGKQREHWDQAEKELTSFLPLLSLGDIFIKDVKSNLWMVVNAACDLLFSPRSSGRKGDSDQPVYLMPGILTDLRHTGDVASKEVTELFEFDSKPYRILWDYRYVRSVRLGDFAREMRNNGYKRNARLALPYALKIQRVWTAHLDRVGLPSPPPMFEEADVSLYTQDINGHWTKYSETIRGGAVLARKKAKAGYNEFCVLTIDGEKSVFNNLCEVIIQAERDLNELKRRREIAPPSEAFWPEKIAKASRSFDKLSKLRQDLTWRLRLLEDPIAISLDLSWVKTDAIALYFIPEGKLAFDKQAQIVIGITRPSVTEGLGNR